MEFTATDLVRKSSEVFNEVQRSGWVKIVNRGRPDMVLLTQDELDGIIKQQYDNGVEKGKGVK